MAFKAKGWAALAEVVHSNPTDILGRKNMKLSHREEGNVAILVPKGKIMGGPDATMLHDQLHDFIKQGKLKVIID